MRKVILGILFLGLLASCKKSDTSAPYLSSGSWTFESKTYNNTKGYPGISNGALISLFVHDSDTAIYPSLVIANNATNPFVTGTFPVQYGLGAITLDLIDSNGIEFIPMLNNTGTINVTANNHSVTLSAAGIKMSRNSPPYSDTSTLTFNITQTY